MDGKMCLLCGTTYPLAEFARSRKGGMCAMCMSRKMPMTDDERRLYRRRYYEANRDNEIQRQRKYYHANKNEINKRATERLRAKRPPKRVLSTAEIEMREASRRKRVNQASARYKAANPERRKEGNRRYYAKKKCGEIAILRMILLPDETLAKFQQVADSLAGKA